jgi:predicted PurR-regulated permease PerM
MAFPPPNERQARLLWFTACAVAVGLLVSLLCLLVWGVGQVLRVLSPVLWPLAVAGVLAYLLDPLVDFLEKRRVPRPRAIGVVFGVAFALFLGLVGSVVPAVVQETRVMVKQVPVYVERVRETGERWMTQPPNFVRHWLGFLPGVPSEPAPLTPVDPLKDRLPAEGDPDGERGVGGAMRGEGAAGEEQSAGMAVPAFWEQLRAAGHLQSATDWVARILPRVASWLFGEVAKVASWFGVLAGLVLIPVYLFYFLLEKQGIQSRWTDYLPVSDSRFKEELVFVLGSINNYMIAFFRGQVLVAICDGVMYTIGFLLIGLPMAVLIGVMATVLTIIPYLGAIVTSVTAVLVAALHFGDLKHPLLVLAVFGVIQGIEGFLIQPKIVGDRVGLHPLTIIVALMVGTAIFGGLLGGILAIPLTAALRVLMFRYVWRKPGRRRGTSGGAQSSGAG